MPKKRANGEGSVYYNRSTNKWEYYFADPLTKKRKKLTANTQKEVISRYKEYMNTSDDLASLDYNQTITSILYEYEENKFKKNLIQPSSFTRNKEAIKKLENGILNKLPIHLVTLFHIDEFSYSISKYSNSTISKTFMLLKKAFEIAEDRKLIKKDILKNYKKPKSSKKDKNIIAFTIDEQKELIKLIPKSKYYHQYIIALNTGMRMGEINALHYNDINLEEKTININKTVSRGENYQNFINDTTKTKNGIRIIPINAILYPILKEFIKDKQNKYLFSELKVISTGQVNSELKRLTNNNNYNTHMLRHTYATRCIEAGVQAVVLKKLLGHSDISITLNTYVDVFDKYEKQNNEIVEKYLLENIYNPDEKSDNKSDNYT